MREPFFDPAAPRPSACPGLFRILPAADGGLCRLKLALGHLASAQARAVAAAARQYGNGIIDATNRANLQLRGIRPDAEAALIEALLAAGLGPTTPAADDIRNVMISPMAGIDPAQLMDAVPLASALLAHLEQDAGARRLSPKFSLLVDGGEQVAMVDHPHDIWLAAMDGETLAVGLAGSPADSPDFTVVCRDAVAFVGAAVALFLADAQGDPEIRRFRDLFERRSRGAAISRLPGRPGDRGWRRRTPLPMGHLGPRAQRQGGLAALGAMPPLGRLSPSMLEGLADLAEARGDGVIRLTPWRSVMIAGCADDDMTPLRALGLVTDPQEPFARIVACVGAAGCRSGRSDTRTDAAVLAAAIDGAGGTVHVSGCAKGCAAPRGAEATLVAAAPGRYDLTLRDGTVARGLTPTEAAVRL